MLNQYAYYQGYLVPPNRLPPQQPQKYQFWYPNMRYLQQNPQQMADMGMQYFLSHKYMPVKPLPQVPIPVDPEGV